MASVCFNLFLLFICILCVEHISASKLNVPRVLLPIFDDFSTNFTLEATESGCYKWSITRADLIQITPEDVDPDTGCSSTAVVSTISKERARNIAVVLAEDIHTRQILRCDIIVDVIYSLVITTTTRELFMEEAPEAFEVRAYDDQGNEFTTLEGIEFDWRIVCNGPNKDLTLLRFMNFKDSPYETPPTMELLDEQNKKGHIVLLEGIKTGSARVIVKLPYVEYKDLPAHEVNLTVIANLIIIPADVYIMQGDMVLFQIIHMNNGRMEEIKFPDAQYYLDVENVHIALSDKDSGFVTALSEGKTRVVLHDRNVADSDPPLKLPAATIHVVAPAYLVLQIFPHKNWAILLAEHHDITAEVYTSTDHKMHIGPGVEIHTQIGEQFHVEQRTQNGSWLTGWAIEQGTAQVQAVLEAVVHPKYGVYKLEQALSSHKELFIFPRIVLSPSEVILPWDPHVRPKYEVEIVATGGDGKFLWSSSNHSVGVVTQAGYVRTHSHGFFEVSAAMMRNHHNRETAKFLILPPSRLEIVEFIMEAEVGSTIYLHIALYAEKQGKDGKASSQIPFTRCQDLPFKVKPSNSKFIQNKTGIIVPVGISCANIAMVGLNVGTSKITVTYFQEGKALEDSVTVSAYKPLRLVHPKHCEIVLAVGTSVHLIFTGGPKPSLGRPADFKRVVVSQNNQTVDAVDVTDAQVLPVGSDDYTVLQVLCRKLGTSEVKLSISNQPVVPNCKNQEGSAVINVICGKPRSIYLQPEIKVADVHSCPMDLSADRVVVQSYQDIELDVTVKDDKGRKFLNISSLKFEWNMSPNELGEFGNKDSVFSRNITEGTIIFANKSYQTITPKSETGIIDVKTKIVGYHKDILNSYGIIPEWPEFITEDEINKEIAPLEAAISLYLVDDTIVTPNTTSIYNHPGNKKVLSVKQGSGYYDISLSSTECAEVKYVEEKRELEIVPIKDGELTIHMIDLCLVSRPAIIIVNIVSVSILRVEMSDKVEIGRCISCIVRLYDENDNLLAVPDLGMVDLKANLEDDIATVQRLREDPEKEPWPLGEIHYVVTGVELGDTKLVFTIGSGDHEVASAPVDLQVFPPLRLYPRNGTILIGATLQISSKGGPQPESNIEYSATISKTADVSKIGLIKGLSLGHTKIKARALGINPTTGQRVIYSQDEIDLHVIPITGIKIGAPLTRFKKGATVPLWAAGIPEQLSPIILGSVNDPIKFEWFVDDNEIAEIHGIFQSLGIEYTPEDQVSVRLVGLAPGRTRIHLNGTFDAKAAECPDLKTIVFSTSLDIEVFEGLQLLTPYGISGKPLLMAPHSSVQLQTNLDSISKLKYTMPGDSSTSEVATQSIAFPNPVVTVSSTGLVKSYNMFGHAMIIITAIDDLGLKQTLGIIVEVKPIHYMMLNVVTNWYIGINSPTNVVPQGAEFELHASYHDNTGAKFSAGSAELKVRSNRFDLVRIRSGYDNSTILIAMRKPGYTILKVWADGYQKTADYIKLNVRQLITPPLEFLTSGDIICMSTPLFKTKDEVGRWTSSERSLLNIDYKTGIGRALGVRGGLVSVTHTLHQAAPLQVLVKPVGKVTMLPHKGRIFVNTLDQDAFEVPLVLLSDTCKDKKNNLIQGWQCTDELQNVALVYPFKCYVVFLNDTVTIDPDTVFKMKSNFNYETGQYICEIHPGTINNPNISIINSNISVWAVTDATGIEADSVEIHFRPAIYLPRVIIVEDLTYKTDLVIHGLDEILDKVKVKPLDEALIFVHPAERPEENTLKHVIQLIDYHYKLNELENAMSLEVSSELTKEIIKVRVKTHTVNENFKSPPCAPGQWSPITSFFYNFRHTIAIIVAMLVIFLASYYVYVNMIQPTIHINVTSDRSLLTTTTGVTAPTSRLTQRSSISPGQSPQHSLMPVQSPQPTCAYLRSLQEQQSSSSANRYGCFCGNPNDPVYGDCNSFYSSSPELRRNRRFM